jgi:hypothetical protein
VIFVLEAQRLYFDLQEADEGVRIGQARSKHLW